MQRSILRATSRLTSPVRLSPLMADEPFIERREFGDMRLKDRVAFVTGAGHGIGAASAERLAREGADLVILDVDTDALEQTADLVRRHDRKALAICVDCTADAEVTEAFARAREAYGRIDILFNNVGQSAREKATEFWCSE